jgi:hypothetical protein
MILHGTSLGEHAISKIDVESGRAHLVLIPPQETESNHGQVLLSCLPETTFQTSTPTVS